MNELATAALAAAFETTSAVGRSALLAGLSGDGGALQDALDFTAPQPGGFYPAGLRNPGLQNDQLAAYQHELDLLKNLGVEVKAPIGGFTSESVLLDAIHEAITRLLQSIQAQNQRGSRQQPLHVVSAGGRDLALSMAQAGLRG